MGDYRDEARQRVKDKATGDRFKLKEGDNVIRILPNVKDKKGKLYPPYKEYMIHYGVGPNKRSVTCGKDVSGAGECWLCDKEIAKMKESKKSSIRDRAAGMEPKAQCAFQIAYIEGGKGKLRGPIWFSVSEGKTNKSLDARLLGLLGNQRKMIADPLKGYNIHIERTGTGPKDTRYGAPELDEEPTPVPKAILEARKPFTDLIKPYDEEEQKKALYGDEEDEEDDDSRSSSRGKSKRGRDEDDEDEDQDDDNEEDESEEDEDEDDEEEKPKKKVKGKKSKDEDEDEDEDESEDEDDEDEDEKPKKKASKKSKSDDDDEDEEEDEDEDDVEEDEEEEDEKPSKKPKKKSKSDDEDDEDEDEEDESEEEDEEEEEDEDDGEEEADEEDEEEVKPKKKLVRRKK